MCYRKREFLLKQIDILPNFVHCNGRISRISKFNIFDSPLKTDQCLPQAKLPRTHDQ